MMRSNIFYGRIFAAASLLIVIGAAANAQPVIRFDPGVEPASLVGREVHRYEVPIPGRFIRDYTRAATEGLLAYVNAPNDLVLPTDFEEREQVVLQSQIDPSASMEMNADLVHLFVNSGMDGYDVEETTPGLPDSNDTAMEQFYMHLANLNLELDENEVGGVQVGGVNMAVRREDGSVDEYRKFVTVRVCRKLDGLPVLGVSRVVARLGEGGMLHSLVYNWTPIARERSETPAQLRSDEDINVQIDEQLRTRGAEAREITVNLSQLVLYDDGTGTVEPVFLVVGDATYVNVEPGEGPEELTIPLDFFVPILTNSTAKLPDYDDFQPTEDF